MFALFFKQIVRDCFEADMGDMGGRFFVCFTNSTLLRLSNNTLSARVMMTPTPTYGRFSGDASGVIAYVCLPFYRHRLKMN